MTPSQIEMENFSIKIIDLVKKNKLEYIDAIITYCEESGLEFEIAAKLITPAIKQHIESEAIKYNLIQKYPILPI